MRRHAIAATTAALAVAALYLLLGLSTEWWPDRSYGRRGDDVHWKLSMATGTTAILLLAVSLTIGPIRRIRSGRRGPVHLPWRRAFGVWAAFTAWTHVVFGITIHATGWRIWVPFTHLWQSQGRLRVLGGSMFVGLAAASILVVLVATSNSSALRKLGAQRWKLVQRSTFIVVILAFVHVTSMQLQEGRALLHVALTLTIFVGIAAIRVAAVRAARVSAPR